MRKQMVKKAAKAAKAAARTAVLTLTLAVCVLCMAKTALAADNEESAGVKAYRAAEGAKSEKKKVKKKNTTIKKHGTLIKARKVTRKILNRLDLKGYNKLMIVAHPDDESIWGGAHLKKDKYLVVCMSYGTHPKRSAEFAKALKLTGDRGIILSHLQETDKSQNRTQRWDACRSAIRQDLKALLSYKNWDLIVTHNPEGEYGHVAHKVTSDVVTGMAAGKNLTDKLYYFGKYYTREQLPKVEKKLKKLDAKSMQTKKQLKKIYKKRYAFRVMLAHILPYENWVPASKWKKTF